MIATGTEAKHVINTPADGQPGPAITSELHHSTEALAQEWDALAQELGATPFAFPGWFDAWLAAFAVPDPLIVAVRRGPALAGVMALADEGSTRSSLTNWHSPRFEPLAADAGAAAALARAAIQARRLSLSFVEAESETMTAIVNAATDAGYAVHSRDAEESPEVAIDGSWDEYLPTISKNMRREFKRRQKRLAAVGEFTFEVHDGSGSLETYVDEAFAVEAASWKGTSGTAVAVDAAMLDFYKRVAAWAAPRGWLRICLMRLDGKPIASDFALEADGVFYSMKGGYDPAYAKYSPGRIMDGLEIQRAHEIGLRRFEFGGDAEHHKLQWRPQFRQLAHVALFAPTPTGRVDRLITVHGRGVARALWHRARSLLLRR